MEKKRDAFPLDRGGEKQGEIPGHPEKNGVVTRHLAVGYGKKVLIRDICLTIGRGEIVTLVGPNGSGKSTILNSLARQLKLAGGEVLIEGTDLQKMKAVSLARKMALVLTKRPSPEKMTCRDVASMGRYPYTGRMGLLSLSDNQKVEEALSLVHALDIAEQPFSQVSDGQKQRILLARAICQEPEILLLDEPTSFLDIRHKIDLLCVLRGLARRGMTILMSLHEIDLAMKVSDHLICVKGDTIEAYGTPEEVMSGERIQKMYELERGSFNELLGSAELPKPAGEADVFVLSCGGSGIPVFRRLQREGRGFLAGILYTNDLDYPVAKALAEEVISEEPFMPIRQETFEKACEKICQVSTVLNAGFPKGAYNQKMQELLLFAKESGKRIEG